MKKENYIKNWNNPFEPLSSEALYWVGYIFADGHLCYNELNRTYSISLFSKDENIMLKFKDFMGEKAKMYKRPTGIIQIVYHSKPTTKWFMDTFNISGKKALVLNPSIIINWDILHGYFDGDGSIRMTLSKGKYKRYEMKFTTGSYIWANRIIEFLEKEEIKTYLVKKGNAYDIIISGKTQLYYVYTHMYSSNTSKLEYKYNQFVALFGDK